MCFEDKKTNAKYVAIFLVLRSIFLLTFSIIGLMAKENFDRKAFFIVYFVLGVVDFSSSLVLLKGVEQGGISKCRMWMGMQALAMGLIIFGPIVREFLGTVGVGWLGFGLVIPSGIGLLLNIWFIYIVHNYVNELKKGTEEERLATTTSAAAATSTAAN